MIQYTFPPLYLFVLDFLLIFVVHIRPTKFFFDGSDKGDGEDEASQGGPVHPGVADLLVKEHKEVDDAEDGPEESHRAGHETLAHLGRQVEKIIGLDTKG